MKKELDVRQHGCIFETYFSVKLRPVGSEIISTDGVCKNGKIFTLASNEFVLSQTSPEDACNEGKSWAWETGNEGLKPLPVPLKRRSFQ